MKQFIRALFVLLGVSAMWPPASIAGKPAWLEGYVVAEKSQSPNGDFGVLIPGRGTHLPEGVDVVNYLADLKSHRVVGEILGVSYSEGENHRGLVVLWAADSSWCVVEYQTRFGFDSIAVLDILGSAMGQADVGEKVQSSLDGVIAKESHNEENGGEATAYYRLGPGRKLRVRSICTTNPKSFEDQVSYYSLFQGTFDINARKWTVTDVRSVNGKAFEALESAYSYDIEHWDKDVGFSSLEFKAEALDRQLNAAYSAVKLLLPSKRFSEIKQEQIAWLKVRDASHSAAEKCNLIEQRIKALQDLLW